LGRLDGGRPVGHARREHLTEHVDRVFLLARDDLQRELAPRERRPIRQGRARAKAFHFVFGEGADEGETRVLAAGERGIEARGVA